MQQTQNQKLSTYSKRASLVLVSILFFLSGAAGLIYQTVWVRLLELYFGVTLTAITLIVSAYMMGLGLGSLLGGRIAGRFRNTVLLYGLIEAAIGVFGLFSPNLISWIGQNTAGSPYLLVFLLSFILLLLPTLLMGMTLPLLTQAFVTRVENSGRVIGLLYGINTLGAAIGALVSGYILMGWFGFGGAILTAACLNFLVGFGALPLKPRNAHEHRQLTDLASEPKVEEGMLWNFNAILGSAFLVGFIGMGFEMLWFRVLGILTKNTAYSFPSILFTFLTALALGGWFWGKKADQSKDPVHLFWKLQISVGLIAASSFLFTWILIDLPQIQPWLQQTFYLPQQPDPAMTRLGGELVLSRRILLLELLEYFIPILILVLPAGLLMGGGLPVLDRISIHQVAVSGRRVGDVHLANIAGSVLGTLVTSFLLLPNLGSEITFKILSLLSAAFLVFVLLTRRAVFHTIMAVPLVGLALLVVVLPGKGGFYARLYQNATSYNSVAIREEGDAVVAITFRGEKTDPAELWIGGLINSYFPSKGTYERSALTCASAVQPRRVLIIGLGGANTARLVTSLAGVDEIVIVELLEGLGDALDEHVPVAQQVFDQPHVRFVVDDGRRYLYANPTQKFDLIFIDPLWSFTAGHNNLYSTEAMQLYKAHLTDGGVFCAWINETHMIYKTAASVFNYTDFFGDYLVNSDQPIEYDLGYMSEAHDRFLKTNTMSLSSSAADLLRPAAVMERRSTDRSQKIRNDSHLPILTDLTPWLEYYFLCPPQFTDRLSRAQLQYCFRDR